MKKNKQGEYKTITHFTQTQDGAEYTIEEGLFYIPDLNSKNIAFKVMKQMQGRKPVIEYCLTNRSAWSILKDMSNRSVSSYIV